MGDGLGKYLILVHAGPQELARAVHGLLYASELHRAGVPVRVIFDGAGTAWLRELRRADHKYHRLFRQAAGAGLIEAACEYCAAAFGVTDHVRAAGIALAGSADGHPSLARYVAEGWTPLVL